MYEFDMTYVCIHAPSLHVRNLGLALLEVKTFNCIDLQGDGDYEIVPDLEINDWLAERIKKVLLFEYSFWVDENFGSYVALPNMFIFVLHSCINMNEYPLFFSLSFVGRSTIRVKKSLFQKENVWHT